MLLHRKSALQQNDPETWKRQWQSLVPPENRDVPITLDGETVIAFVQMNQFVMMLQDGLLMEAAFFDVCSFFQRAGYHVVWLMRCTQDIHNGYLKPKGFAESGTRRKWLWKSPTTNFGRWTSDNFNATILLQHEPLPDGDIRTCEKPILQRVIWAESDDPTRMVPGKTRFLTADLPATPQELLQWLSGTALSKLRTKL